MENSTIVILVLIIALWLYSIVSIFSNEFKDEEQKVFWKIGIIFVPLLAFFYVFYEKEFTEVDRTYLF